jgi:putative aldouronate transport system permease protein
MTTTLAAPRPDRAAPGRRPLAARVPDRAVDLFSIIVLTVAVVAILYPLWFILVASVSDPAAVYEGRVWFWPSGFTLDGYDRIVGDAAVWRGFANSVLYTVVGTTISVCLIVAGGYALSRKDLPGRRTITFLLVLTLFFDGGIIPRYLVVQELGLLDSLWAVTLPGAIGVWNLIIAKSFFQLNIPDELREAAQLDGAGDLRFFFTIAVPLARSLIVLMVMIHMVASWNAFFDALIFLNDADKYPLQLVLRNILIQSDISTTGAMSGDLASYAETQRIADLVKYGIIVVSTFPVLMLIPFLQKHFTKGALLGAVKS